MGKLDGFQAFALQHIVPCLPERSEGFEGGGSLENDPFLSAMTSLRLFGRCLVPHPANALCVGGHIFRSSAFFVGYNVPHYVLLKP